MITNVDVSVNRSGVRYQAHGCRTLLIAMALSSTRTRASTLLLPIPATWQMRGSDSGSACLHVAFQRSKICCESSL